MASIQDLFHTLLKPNQSSIVFGNLGRRVNLIIYHLNTFFNDWVVEIRSRWDKPNVETFCDVLVWIEPFFQQEIVKPHYAKCMIVFTSHLNLIYSNIPIVYHFLGNCNYESLLSKRKKQVKPDYIFRPSIFHTTTFESFSKNVIIDLYGCKDDHEALVCFLNALETLNVCPISHWDVYDRNNLNFLKKCDKVLQYLHLEKIL